MLFVTVLSAVVLLNWRWLVAIGAAPLLLARRLGFSVDEVRSLLDLWRDSTRSNADVKALAMRHVRELDRKIEELTQMRVALTDLIVRCRGDMRPDCPILDELGDARSR